MAVQNSAAEVPITSPLAVLEWPAGNGSVHDQRHAGDLPDADRLAQVPRAGILPGPAVDRVLQLDAHPQQPDGEGLPQTSPPSTVNGVSNSNQTCAHTAARSYHPGGVNVSFERRLGQVRQEHDQPHRLARPGLRSAAARSSAPIPH